MRKIFNFQFSIFNSKGVTLYIAIGIMGVLLFVSFAMVNVAIKSTLFASSSRDSQLAFFAADAGAECAMYWDIVHNSFATSTDGGGTVTCFGSNIVTDGEVVGTSTVALIGEGGDGGTSPPGDITRVNQVSSPSPGSSSALSISTPLFQANTVGNLIVVGVRHKQTVGGGQTVTGVIDSALNTYNRATTVTSTCTVAVPDCLNSEIWYTIVTTGHTSANNVVTANFSGSVNHRVIMAAQYSGVSASSPLGTIASGPRQVAIPVVSGPFTTTGPKELVIAFSSALYASASAWTPGNGYNAVRTDMNNRASFMEEKFVPVTETNTASASTPASNPKNIVVATFKAASGTSNGRGPTSLFGFNMPNVQSCAVVTVNKRYVGSVLETSIESRGYNTCDMSHPRRVERGVEITY